MKKRFLKTALRSLLSWKWAAWPFKQETCDLLDSLQRCAASLLWPLSRNQDEPTVAFWERQRKDTRTLVKDIGLWSEEYARSVSAWGAHVRRNHSATWCLPLLEWKGKTWLEGLRSGYRDRWQSVIDHSLSMTGTRDKRGRPPRRWETGESLAAAMIAGG